jgi:hypothetical protein
LKNQKKTLKLTEIKMPEQYVEIVGLLESNNIYLKKIL